MDLLCAEKISQDSCFAMKDLNVLDDERVLRDLLKMEQLYVPQCDYFRDVQTEVSPQTRQIVVKWMLEVCERIKCEDPVFPLAVNMFDRFLCSCDTPKKFLQLVAADCILMASKIRQAVTIPIDTLCYYTNYSVNSFQMRKYELLLLAKLNWDLLAVTGFDFIDHILQRIKWNRDNNEMIRRHSLILLHLCYTENDFMLMKPSTIATSCIISAIKGLKIKIDNSIIVQLCKLTESPVDVVLSAVNRLEWIVAKEASLTMNNNNVMYKSVSPHEKSTSAMSANSDQEKPETPTDVQDVDF